MYYDYSDYEEVWAAECNALTRDMENMSGVVIYNGGSYGTSCNSNPSDDKGTPERMKSLVDQHKNIHPYFMIASMERAIQLASSKNYNFGDFCKDNGYYARTYTREAQHHEAP